VRLRTTTHHFAFALLLGCGLLAGTPALAQKTACIVSDLAYATASAKAAAPATKVADRLAPAERKAAAEDSRKAVTRSQEEALKKFPKSGGGGGGFLSLFSPSDAEKGTALDRKRLAQARVLETSYLNPILQRYAVSCAELRDIVAAEQPAAAAQSSSGAAPGAR
jgi:hypothetical protein